MKTMIDAPFACPKCRENLMPLGDGKVTCRTVHCENEHKIFLVPTFKLTDTGQTETYRS